MTTEESLRMTSTPHINEGHYFELYILKGGVVIGDVPPPASTKGLVLNFIFRKM